MYSYYSLSRIVIVNLLKVATSGHSTRVPREPTIGFVDKLTRLDIWCASVSSRSIAINDTPLHPHQLLLTLMRATVKLSIEVNQHLHDLMCYSVASSFTLRIYMEKWSKERSRVFVLWIVRAALLIMVWWKVKGVKFEAPLYLTINCEEFIVYSKPQTHTI
mgnify:CR=1 FL=1